VLLRSITVSKDNITKAICKRRVPNRDRCIGG
jgi:hypothetical protein